MWGVARAGDQAGLDGGGEVRLHDLKLRLRAVGVVGALQAEGRDTDDRQETGDVEVAEARVEPGAVPAMEGVVGVAVIAREAGAEVAGFVRVLDLADAGDVEVFDEEVGCDGDQGVEVDVGALPGMAELLCVMAGGGGGAPPPARAQRRAVLRARSEDSIAMSSSVTRPVRS
jgi:hypothetical protein